jgi:hypothetical protein
MVFAEVGTGDWVRNRVVGVIRISLHERSRTQNTQYKQKYSKDEVHQQVSSISSKEQSSASG